MNFILSLGVLTVALTAKEPQPQSVQPLMMQFMAQVVKLQPYMASTKAFSSKQNQKDIENALASLSKLAGQINHLQQFNTPVFEISADALKSHLEQLEVNFKRGDSDFTRRMLAATLDGCSSCHIQVTGKSNLKWKVESFDLKGSLVDKADFWYTIRQYDQALKLFTEALSQQKKSELTTWEIENALKKILSIYLRSKRDPKAAIKFIEKTLEDKSLPPTIRAQMTEWLGDLQILVNEKSPHPAKATAKDIENYAAGKLKVIDEEGYTGLENKDLPRFLFVSGILYDYLNRHPQAKATPELLYWLAVCDKALNQQFFFSLYETYLKKCIQMAPHTPSAQRCYETYRDSMIAESTGSSGINMPEDIQKELEELKKIAYPK